MEKVSQKKNSEGQKVSNTPQCPVVKKCGGCKGFGLSYNQQLQKKVKVLEEQCGQFGKFEPIAGMKNPYHYRNKVHAVFGEDRRHNIISGIYEEGTHRIVPVDSCLLEDKRADEIIVSIRGLLKSFKIRPYHEDTGYGLFRHVLIRTGYATGQIMVVLVLASPILPSKNNFVKALLKLHPEITTIVLNVNSKDTSMILGEKETVLYGKGYIEDTLLGKTFRISSRSFYQVNPVQTEKLYQKAIAYADLSGKETVLDAYCGTGTIGLIASGSAKEVIGVELNSAAVKDARINAKQNRVSNIMFYEKDAGEFIRQMAEQQASVDVVFMDPPRAGSTEVFLDSLVTLKPKRIVYVSCNPETLARDLRYLKRKGYRMAKGAGVDMFPWTSSIEAVVLLTPQKR
ncbi:MAG: 23S rRNA (uracil(1939)-C(5))-methyltransferase RlmD [Lachnospiraceae bacterium]|nr:23S rRNA (uracil(1939)-C(5))-methyltransferase RlmD [Lachnospiraceae bacterium]